MMKNILIILCTLLFVNSFCAMEQNSSSPEINLENYQQCTSLLYSLINNQAHLSNHTLDFADFIDITKIYRADFCNVCNTVTSLRQLNLTDFENAISNIRNTINTDRKAKEKAECKLLMNLCPKDILELQIDQFEAFSQYQDLNDTPTDNLLKENRLKLLQALEAKDVQLFKNISHLPLNSYIIKSITDQIALHINNLENSPPQKKCGVKLVS